MTELKRYGVYDNDTLCGDAVEDVDGQWCLFEDVEPLLKQKALDDETKRMLVELLTEVRDATCLTPWSARIKAKRLLEKLGAG